MQGGWPASQLLCFPNGQRRTILVAALRRHSGVVGYVHSLPRGRGNATQAGRVKAKTDLILSPAGSRKQMKQKALSSVGSVLLYPCYINPGSGHFTSLDHRTQAGPPQFFFL